MGFMLLMKWDKLPLEIRKDAVRPYYDVLASKKIQLFIKRCIDILLSFFALVFTLPFFIIISILIKMDSKGPVLFKQERVGFNGKKFKILKFRTMVVNAESLGTQITVGNDPRVTKTGRVLRAVKADELPQLINILIGQMSFIGTRPEVEKYVVKYTDKMYATLIMRPGLSSVASVKFKDENNMVSSDNVEELYVNTILPQKMEHNLSYIKNFKISDDFKIVFQTLLSFFN